MAVGFIPTWVVVGNMPEKEIAYTRPIDARPASDKGYPNIMDRALYFVYREHGDIVAYTTATEIDECVFLVGNTWGSHSHRGKGLHTEILKWRNEKLRDWGATHIYACLNPQDGVALKRLEDTVSQLGYKKVGAMGMQHVRLWTRVHVLCSGLPVWGKEL